MGKQPPRKLLDLDRNIARRKHYTIRDGGAYINWIKRYILFHDRRHPKEMSVPSSCLSTDPRSDVVRRQPRTLQREVSQRQISSYAIRRRSSGS